MATFQGRLKLKGFRGTTQDTVLRVTTKSSQGSGLAPPAPSWTGRSGGSQTGPSHPQCWWRECPCYPSYREARSEAWSVQTLLRGCVVTSCCGTPSQQLCKKDKFLIKISQKNQFTHLTRCSMRKTMHAWFGFWGSWLKRCRYARVLASLSPRP